MHGDEKELHTQQHLSPQLGNLLEFISVQQKRIADAQERKADAELQKADALQKRAEAQKLMADALNRIAEALCGNEETEPAEADILSGDEEYDAIESVSPESDGDANTEDVDSAEETEPPEIHNVGGGEEDIPADGLPPEPVASEAAEQETLPDDYKSKIISRIITLKEKKGFSIDATVSYLNEKGFKPISSEGLWDRDMVSKIFSHINTVRKNRDS